MALLSLQGVVLVVLTYAAFIYVASIIHQRRLRRLAVQYNALLPAFAQSKLPFNLDFLWRFLNASRNKEDIFTILADSYAKNGTTFESPGLFTDSRLNTIDPINIQAILATQFQDFELGQQLNRRLLLGKCIFTTDGPFWEHSRAMFKPQFARDQINNLQETEVAVQEFFRAISLVGTENAGGKSVEVNLLPMFYRFTMDTATKFLFGESVETQISAATGGTGKMTSAAVSLATEFGSELNFADALSEAQIWITQRIRLQGLHWLIPSKRGRTANAFVRKYAAHYVQLALQSATETKTSSEPSSSGAYSLLETLIESTRDPDELRDQILGLLLAGRDTTASLLSWTALLLARHPDEFAKLRATVLQHFGPYTADPSSITFETLKSCRYLQFTLREALRLYDPSPANVRFAARDTTLPRGGGPDGQAPIFVPKGKTVSFVLHLLHRRKDLWGPDADQFRPKRWEKRKIDWSFVPFSGGPRICLGQQYALTEASYLIVRILQRFEKIEWLGGPDEPRKTITFTMQPRDGVPISALALTLLIFVHANSLDMAPARTEDEVSWTTDTKVLNGSTPHNGSPRNVEHINAIRWDQSLEPKHYEISGTDPDSKILFLDVKILDSTGSEPYHGDVLIEGQRFAAVGEVPNIEALKQDPRVRLFQGRGRTLMSGLGDGHTHFTWNGGDLDHLGDLGIEEHTLVTMKSAKSFLDSGYTMCFGAASAKERLDVVIRDAINAGDIPGPRYLANGKELARRDGILVAGITAAADGPDEMREVIRHHVNIGVDNVKLSMSGEEITETHAAQDCYFTDEETAACVDEAHKHGKRLCAHARARDSVIMCVKHGVEAIYHASFIDDQGMDMLEEAKTKHVVVPAINWLIATLHEAEAFGYTHAQADKAGYTRELDAAIAGLREMHRRGIVVLPGGDYGFAWTPHGTYPRDLEHFVKLLGFTPHEAIIAATAGVAALMMRSHELGRVQKGYYADCILVDGDPLADISILQDHTRLNVICINGRVHKADGKDRAF